MDLQPSERSNESLKILATELGNELTRYVKQMVLSTPPYGHTDWSGSLAVRACRRNFMSDSKETSRQTVTSRF